MDATAHLLGMLPRAAERFVVFACAAAQFYVLPRTMVPRAEERFVVFAYAAAQ